MTDFRPGQSAPDAHSALKESLAILEKAQQCAVLWFGDIMERKLFRELGYSSINQYAQQGLGWSRTRTTDYIQLAQKLEKLPQVKEEVASGKLGYTKAREVVKVADPANEKQWVDRAKKLNRRDLEKEIKVARREAADQAKGQPTLLPPGLTTPEGGISQPEPPKASGPVRISWDMSPDQVARFEAVWERLRKVGGLPADRVEALLAALSGYADMASPMDEVESSAERMPPRGTRPPVQIHVHQCPDCQKNTVQTQRGELVMGRAQTERIRCDAAVSRPGHRNTTTIPPATRRKVLSRDRHRCRGRGCGNTRFLEVHHVVPRSRGGGNEPENLVTLCAACHQLVHEHGPGCDFLTETPG